LRSPFSDVPSAHFWQVAEKPFESFDWSPFDKAQYRQDERRGVVVNDFPFMLRLSKHS